jgi:predicted nucleotidyltransferase
MSSEYAELDFYHDSFLMSIPQLIHEPPIPEIKILISDQKHILGKEYFENIEKEYQIHLQKLKQNGENTLWLISSNLLLTDISSILVDDQFQFIDTFLQRYSFKKF